MRQWLQVKDSSGEYDYIQHPDYRLIYNTYSTNTTPSMSGMITELDLSHAVTPGEKRPYYRVYTRLQPDINSMDGRV
jgi:hypothetical protein